MQPPKKLRFRAVGDLLVPNLARSGDAAHRYIGRELKALPDGEHGYVPTGEPAEVDYRAEYVEYAKAGELTPADKETAEACGLAFSAPKPLPTPFSQPKDGDK